jgi:hypothetical protein
VANVEIRKRAVRRHRECGRRAPLLSPAGAGAIAMPLMRFPADGPLRPAGEPDRAPSPVPRGGKGLLLFVSLQLPLSPMMGFSRRVEHALDVTVQRLHDANLRKHRRAAGRSHQYQGFHRRLPFRRLVLGLRKLGDVVAGILQRDQRPAARQRNRFVEAAGPGQSLRPN